MPVCVLLAVAVVAMVGEGSVSGPVAECVDEDIRYLAEVLIDLKLSDLPIESPSVTQLTILDP